MKELVIVNGPPGVGKTAVSHSLSALLSGTVRIEGDALRAFVPENAREHLGGGSTYRAAAVLAKAYLEMGAHRVIFDYVFLRPSHVEHFREFVERPLYFFTLWAPLDVVEARERARGGGAPLGPAVGECYREIESNRECLGHFLPTVGTAAATPRSAMAPGR